MLATLTDSCQEVKTLQPIRLRNNSVNAGANPFHCAGARGFGDWPDAGEGTVEFLVFLLFLVAVHSQPTSPQNGLPTVPVILVADSIVPLNATVKVTPPLPSCSQPNTTLFPFTAPVILRGPNGPE